MRAPLASLLCSVTLLAGFVATTSSPASHAGAYVDTKKRFELEQEPGWLLAPLPGDVTGMIFRRTIDGVPGTLRISVRVVRAGETTKESLDEAEAFFRNELGYKPGGDVPTSVGLMPAVRRTLSVYASGDKKTVRAIELYALHAFGHLHLLHFETLEKRRKDFARDVDRMLGTYRPLVGKGVYAPLTGTWINLGGGPDLVLDEDAHFNLGPLDGGFSADGGALVLHVREGEERYQYVLVENQLRLKSPNLGGEMIFKRSGAARVKAVDDKPQRAPGPLTREELIGTWRVVEGEGTEVLQLMLSPSGSVAFGPLSGRWRYSTGRLTITSTAGVTVTYSASMNAGKLVMGGGDLDRDLILERE